MVFFRNQFKLQKRNFTLVNFTVNTSDLLHDIRKFVKRKTVTTCGRKVYQLSTLRTFNKYWHVHTIILEAKHDDNTETGHS